MSICLYNGTLISGFATMEKCAILLEEGKMADRLYLIRKGCLHLIFYNEGKTSFPNFFFERDIVASFDNLYKHTPSLFLFRKYRTNGNIGNKKA